jgi:hypothetical protein
MEHLEIEVLSQSAVGGLRHIIIWVPGLLQHTFFGPVFWPLKSPSEFGIAGWDREIPALIHLSGPINEKNICRSGSDLGS